MRCEWVISALWDFNLKKALKTKLKITAHLARTLYLTVGVNEVYSFQRNSTARKNTLPNRITTNFIYSQFSLAPQSVNFYWHLEWNVAVWYGGLEGRQWEGAVLNIFLLYMISTPNNHFLPRLSHSRADIINVPNWYCYWKCFCCVFHLWDERKVGWKIYWRKKGPQDEITK